MQSRKLVSNVQAPVNEYNIDLFIMFVEHDFFSLAALRSINCLQILIKLIKLITCQYCCLFKILWYGNALPLKVSRNILSQMISNVVKFKGKWNHHKDILVMFGDIELASRQ